MTILSCNNIKKTYLGQTKPVIDGISLELEQGCFVSIMGRSGSGKSTLLKIMCGLISPDTGEINVAGYDVNNLSAKEKSYFRSQMMGIVFQDGNLISDYNVEDNIITPLLIAKNKLDKEYYLKILEITEITGLTKKMPSTLSGGERQRTAIARALIAKPKIIFADEPTGNLDSKSEGQVMRLFTTINQELGTSIIQVTHSQFCASISKQVIRINDGRIE